MKKRKERSGKEEVDKEEKIKEEGTRRKDDETITQMR
jgi:hypothetical protein